MIRFCLFLLGSLTLSAQLPPNIRNTQPGNAAPPSPAAAARQITVPDGFRVTLFAGDPDVAQPIALNHDDRGRLWVAESYSYIEWKRKAQDRILIFEDVDHDGRHDRRKVFWDAGNHLSGFQIGHGGVWVCDAPNLLFIPDRNHDDVPDGEPVIILDGWAEDAEHNFFNGLTWGPDGWLYGRHGIKKPSRVGRPGTPDADRVELSCCIWRVHPRTHEFEVVADGTINPWGLDWNADGQAFFTTSVVDHLWHLVPGARYARWENRRGGHPDPHTYELMRPASDHRHWTGGEKERRKPGHERQGGGHSHCGLMIYQAGRWPAAFQGRAFFNNVHGHRVNMDHLHRERAGYRAAHGPDFLLGNNDWFRGVEILQGPDGNAILAEWTDLGECHDRDGVHRTSGRLFKISHGEPARSKPFDLSRSTDEELVGHLTHENSWWRRHALRLLQERHGVRKSLKPTLTDRLREQGGGATTIRDAVTAVQALATCSRQALPELFSRNAGIERTPVRAQIVQALFHGQTPTAADADWLGKQIAGEGKTPNLVHLHAAAALQRLPLDQRWQLAAALAAIPTGEKDRNFELMLWYGFEPLVVADRKRALKIAVASNISLLRRLTARRITDARR